MRSAELTFGIVNTQAIVVEQAGRKRIVFFEGKPALVRVMNEFAIGDVFTPKLVVVEEITVQTFDELAQR